MSVKPGWVTAEVVEQIRVMRETCDFSIPAQIILADRLHEANCPDPHHATRLRGGLGYWHAAREVSLILGGEYEEAVQHIEHLAIAVETALNKSKKKNTVPGVFDFAWIMNAFYNYQLNGTETYFGEDIPDQLCSHVNVSWAAFEKITNMKIPASKKATHPFNTVPESDEYSCAC